MEAKAPNISAWYLAWLEEAFDFIDICLNRFSTSSL
jgi:hypothetical protein